MLRVKALDDVLVMQVSISIRDASGTLLEQGPATSVDMPDNITEMSKSSGA